MPMKSSAINKLSKIICKNAIKIRDAENLTITFKIRNERLFKSTGISTIRLSSKTNPIQSNSRNNITIHSPLNEIFIDSRGGFSINMSIIFNSTQSNFHNSLHQSIVSSISRILKFTRQKRKKKTENLRGNCNLKLFKKLINLANDKNSELIIKKIENFIRSSKKSLNDTLVELTWLDIFRIAKIMDTLEIDDALSINKTTLNKFISKFNKKNNIIAMDSGKFLEYWVKEINLHGKNILYNSLQFISEKHSETIIDDELDNLSSPLKETIAPKGYLEFYQN